MSGTRLDHVEGLLRALDKRALVFGTDAIAFGDPAWAILLELYLAHERGAQFATSDAARGSRAPASTGLRYVLYLEELGLVRRMQDLNDRRRQIVELTTRAVHLIERWLEHTAPIA